MCLGVATIAAAAAVVVMNKFSVKRFKRKESNPDHMYETNDVVAVRNQDTRM